jgi:hypothetical protein
MKPLKIQNLDGSKAAIVRYTPDVKEYIVKFYFKGELRKEATYFTDDKDDAIQTAQTMVN